MACLIAFTLVSQVLWGPGTFCGWLCPFGAAGVAAHLPACPLRLLSAGCRRCGPAMLEVIAAVLAALVAAAAFAPQLAEKGVEIEPFKTAITVVRPSLVSSWPGRCCCWRYGGITSSSCRHLCPLGAAG